MPDTPSPPSDPPAGHATSVSTIAALLDRAETLRQTALDAGLAHAHARNQLAAALLRTRWPTAGVVDADLSRRIASEANPEVWAVLDSDGHRLWSRRPRERRDGLVEVAESALALALDFADPAHAGWLRMEVLGVGIHRLTLSPGALQGRPGIGDGPPTDTAEPLPWKSVRRAEGGWPWRRRRR